MVIAYLPIAIGLFVIFYGWFLISRLKKTSGSEDAIVFGETTYYRNVGIAAVVVVLLVWVLLGWRPSVALALGVVLAELADIVIAPLRTRLKAGVRDMSRRGASQAFALAFRTGLGVGLWSVALSLCAVAVVYSTWMSLQTLAALAVGVGIPSILGISGKQGRSNGIQLQVVALALAMIMGGVLFPQTSQFVAAPLFLASVVLLAIVVISPWVKITRASRAMHALRGGLWAGGVLSAAGGYFLIAGMAQGQNVALWSLCASIFIGAGVAMATTFSSRLKWTVLNKVNWCAMALVIAGLVASYWCARWYGVGLATVSLLFLAPLAVAMGEYGVAMGDASLHGEPSRLAPGVKEALAVMEASGKRARMVSATYVAAAMGYVAVAAWGACLTRAVQLSGSSAGQLLAFSPGFFIGALTGGGAMYGALLLQRKQRGVLAFFLLLFMVLGVGWLFGAGALLMATAGSVLVGLSLLGFSSAEAGEAGPLCVFQAATALLFVSFFI